jgi:hypothetical protein
VTSSSGNTGAAERMMKHDEGNHVNDCTKTQHVVPHAGKKHANYETVGLPHAKMRLCPKTTSADATVTSDSANTGAAKKMVKHDAGRHVNCRM